VSPPDLVRLAAALAQSEIALVRRDPVAGALLTQAARHGDGLEGGEMVAAAARLARATGGREAGREGAAARKAVQALCRTAVIENDAALLTSPQKRKPVS
jgi:hypothetical protein